MLRLWRGVFPSWSRQQERHRRGSPCLSRIVDDRGDWCEVGGGSCDCWVLSNWFGSAQHLSCLLREGAHWPISRDVRLCTVIYALWLLAHPGCLCKYRKLWKILFWLAISMPPPKSLFPHQRKTWSGPLSLVSSIYFRGRVVSSAYLNWQWKLSVQRHLHRSRRICVDHLGPISIP